MAMDYAEMVRILEKIIRDEGTDATMRCMAIRTLREVQADEGELLAPGLERLYSVGRLDERRRGRRGP
jgi:hypothetical protein